MSFVWNVNTEVCVWIFFFWFQITRTDEFFRLKPNLYDPSKCCTWCSHLHKTYTQWSSSKCAIFCDFFTNYSLSFLLKQLVPKYSKVVSRQTFTLTVLVWPFHSFFFFSSNISPDLILNIQDFMMNSWSVIFA